jgi:hypothetical protein
MPPVRFLRISDETFDLLGRLAAAAGKSREVVLEELVRTAAETEGLTPPPEGAFLELEAVDETPAIGPGGRGRRVRLVAVDETGEQDLGDFFVPDDTPSPG